MNNSTPTLGNPAQNPAIDAIYGQTAPNQTQVNALLKVIDDLMPFVLEEYYPYCATPDFKAAVEAAIKVQSNKPKLHTTVTDTQTNSGFKIPPPRRVSLADLIKRQNEERGLEPLPLDPELLLKRVSDGGHSGQFLADAFISTYRIEKPFTHSLGELIKLDAEGFRLFHQILHIRHISGWNDNALYHIEQQIKAILKEGEL